MEKQTKLSDSEARYRRLFETAQEGILILNASTGQIEDVNPYLVDMLGYSHEEFLGKKLWEIRVFKNAEVTKKAFVELQEKEYIRYEDLPLETESGEVIDVEFVSNVYTINGNGEKVIQCDIRDISKRKQAEKGLEKSESEFRLLTEKMSDMLWTTDMEMNVTYISPSVEVILGFTPEEYSKLPVQERVTPESIQCSEEILAAELQYDKERDPGRFGVIDLVFYHKDGSVRNMETSLSLIPDDNGNPVGIYGLARDVTERKRAEKDLSESREELQAIYDGMGDGVMVIDLEYQTILRANPALALMLGYSEEELVGMPVNTVHPAGELYRVGKEFEKNDELGEDRIGDLLCLRKDGSTFLVEITGMNIDYRGRSCAVAILKDITERKEKEEEVLKFKTVSDRSNYGIGIIDLDGNLEYVNDYFASIHGYRPEELLGKKLRVFHNEEQLGRVTELLGILLTTGTFDAEEVWHVHKDGSTFPMLMNGVLVKDEKGNPLLMACSAVDISERKQTEKGLEESESRFRLLTEKMSDLLWTTDLRMNATYVSPSVEAILGFTPDEYSKVPIQERVTLESLQSSGEILTDELQGDKKRDPGRSYLIDLDFYHKDGSVRNMETSLSLVRDGNGNPVGIYGLSRDVTERKQAEENLKENKARLEAINNEAMDALILVDKKGILHHWNPAAERIFGYSPEESLGRSIEIWIPEPHQREYVDAIAEFINTGVQRLTSKEPTEFVALKRDGTEIYTEIAVSRLEIGDEWYAELTVRDITERKEAKDELLKLEGELYEALDTLPDLMFEVDSGGLIHDYRAPQTDLLCISPSDFIGKTVEEALPENASKSIMDAISNAAVRAEGHGYATYSLEMPDGTHWYEASIAPKGKIGNDRLVALVRDITERKWAEEALKQYATQLEAANTELESFSYSVSHDLRAPLRAVKGFGKMLLKKHSEELDEEGKRLLDIIISNTESMEGLIEGLLVLSGINREDLRTEKLDMISLAKDCIGELDVEGRDVEFIVHNLPSAEGGRTLVRQVFLNLIANAVKFTGKKEKAVIEIGSETQNGQDVYFVKDNGDGFDMKHSDNLFGVFKRLHKEDDFPGIGIGLATVQRIINRHGGKVWAEGKKGEGATFYFFLPVKEVRWKKNSVS